MVQEEKKIVNSIEAASAVVLYQHRYQQQQQWQIIKIKQFFLSCEY